MSHWLSQLNNFELNNSKCSWIKPLNPSSLLFTQYFNNRIYKRHYIYTWHKGTEQVSRTGHPTCQIQSQLTNGSKYSLIKQSNPSSVLLTQHFNNKIYKMAQHIQHKSTGPTGSPTGSTGYYTSHFSFSNNLFFTVCSFGGRALFPKPSITLWMNVNVFPTHFG